MRPPIILANAGYLGTLAAARSLGRAGIKVIVADPSAWSRTRFSRHAAEYVKCPQFEDTSEWIDWLISLGQRGPRCAVYATSDAVSFALARHKNEIAKYFDLYQPDIETVLSVLDKKRLLQCAQDAGLGAPATWLPRSAQEAGQIAAELGGRLIIKPRSQLAHRHMTKAHIVDANPTTVRDLFTKFEEDAAWDGEFLKIVPDAKLPMIQRFYPASVGAVYSLSGFRDENGRTVFRAAWKTLQIPLQTGNGICFEPAALEREVAERTELLCDRIGYYGAFELEFIRGEHDFMLIDFNGRFYGQMAYDIGRGMDLPRLAYEAATGGTSDFARVLAESSESDEHHSVAYRYGLELNLTGLFGRMLGMISEEERRQWRQWPNDKFRAVVDAVADPTDPMPGVFDLVHYLTRAMRRPRSFIHGLMR
jgi:predicted ATP-grasp superfamily ATP-dependent carboligase